MSSTPGTAAAAAGYPIQIYNIQGEKRRLDTAAIANVLEPINDTPVAFVSVNGIKRSGKSFLLNFFLKYLQREDQSSSNWLNTNQELVGFDWRGGADRKTVGIWIWSKPFIIKPNGDNIAVILMDTQGSFDGQTGFRDNAIIFAISTWLSSVFIYNVQQDLSEDNLEFYKYFADFSNNVKNFDESFTAGNANSNTTDDSLFQHLILLIRDWSWPDNYAYGWHHSSSSTAADNKNYAAYFVNGKADNNKDAVALRKDIASKFQHISSYLMPNPGLTVSQRVEPTLPPLHKIEKMFLDHLQLLIKGLFEEIVAPKIIYGEVQHGRHILEILKKWATFLHENRIPEVKNFNEAVAEAQLEMALNRSAKQCQTKLLQLAENGIEPKKFDRKCEQICSEVLAKFLESTRRFESFQENYMRTLQEMLKNLRQTYFQFNASKKTEKEQKEQIEKIKLKTKQLTDDITVQQGLIKKHEADLKKQKELNKQQRRERKADLKKLAESARKLEDEKDLRIQELKERNAQLEAVVHKPKPTRREDNRESTGRPWVSRPSCTELPLPGPARTWVFPPPCTPLPLHGPARRGPSNGTLNQILRFWE